MHLIFTIFFFFLIFVLAIVASIVIRIVRMGKNFTNLFKRGHNNDSNYGSQRSWFGSNKSKEKEKAKVFGDDEGEYVDFEEIK